MNTCSPPVDVKIPRLVHTPPGSTALCTSYIDPAGSVNLNRYPPAVGLGSTPTTGNAGRAPTLTHTRFVPGTHFHF